MPAATCPVWTGTGMEVNFWFRHCVQGTCNGQGCLPDHLSTPLSGGLHAPGYFANYYGVTHCRPSPPQTCPAVPPAWAQGCAGRGCREQQHCTHNCQLQSQARPAPTLGGPACFVLPVLECTRQPASTCRQPAHPMHATCCFLLCRDFVMNWVQHARAAGVHNFAIGGCCFLPRQCPG